MLWLEVSVGEKLCIGDDVVVCVKKVSGKAKSARLAIAAPREKNISVQADIPTRENFETQSGGSCRTDWKALRELRAKNRQAVNTQGRKCEPTGTTTQKPVRSIKELHPLCVGS